MKAKAPLVVVTRKWPERVEARLKELFNVELNAADTPFTEAELADAVARADAVCPTVTDRITGAVLDQPAPRAKLLANFGVGVDHIDLPAAERMGISISNTPDVLTDATAEIAMALLLMSARRTAEGERLVRRGAWGGWCPTHMLSTQVSGKTLGLVGMGRIGSRFARQASQGFGMKIQYTSRSEVPEERLRGLNASRVSLQQLLVTSDFVSLHCPATAETRHLIDASALDCMPGHAHLINTARGPVVDEEALATALAEGKIAGAGLDVYEQEPTVHPGLLGLEQVVLLPHMGSGALETREAMGMKVVDNLLAFFSGDPPPDLLV
jgi:lactate dehydrogenase-like 2-hydroxyacid dehydrogenase